jgi:hypothetical protein
MNYCSDPDNWITAETKLYIAKICGVQGKFQKSTFGGFVIDPTSTARESDTILAILATKTIRATETVVATRTVVTVYAIDATKVIHTLTLRKNVGPRTTPTISLGPMYPMGFMPIPTVPSGIIIRGLSGSTIELH